MATSTEKAIFFFVIIILIIFVFLQVPIFLGIQYWGPTEHITGFPFTILPLRLAALLPMLILFILWLVVVVWVYRDAEQRQMNGLLWGLLVFVGNFVGLLIYLIVRSNNLPAQTVIATKPCPGCGERVNAAFDFCPHCGNRMKAVCSSCNKQISEDWQVCPYCGNKLPEK